MSRVSGAPGSRRSPLGHSRSWLCAELWSLTTAGSGSFPLRYTSVVFVDLVIFFTKMSTFASQSVTLALDVLLRLWYLHLQTLRSTYLQQPDVQFLPGCIRTPTFRCSLSAKGPCCSSTYQLFGQSKKKKVAPLNNGLGSLSTWRPYVHKLHCEERYLAPS